MADASLSSSSAAPAADASTSSVALDRGLKILSGIAAVTIVGRFIYQQLHSTGASPAGEPPVVTPEAQAQLDATLARLKQAKVIAILRLKNLDRALERVVELADMGYTALEVTTDSVGFEDGLLQKVQALIGDRCMIGVGTITTLDQLRIAKEGGAAFALSPVRPTHGGFEHHGFVRECHARGIVAMPAAFSPQEIYEAQEAGASTIKLFPAQKWTSKQLKDLKAVGDFGTANICPSGGIDHDNAAEWLAAGATAVGMGSCLAGRDIKIADSDSPEFHAATDRWVTTEKPAAAALAQRLGLGGGR